MGADPLPPSRSLEGVVGDPPPLPLPARPAARPGAGLRLPGDFLDFLVREHGPDVDYFRAFVAGILAPADDPAAERFREALRVLDSAWEAVSRGDLASAEASAEEGARIFALDLRKAASKKSSPAPRGRNCPRCATRCSGSGNRWPRSPPGDAAARFLVARAGAALAQYEAAKGSGLDFMDLLLRASDLLAGNPAVARRLGERFRHIFVDEFQDTDPLQAGVLRAIAADAVPGRLFVVGDPKQSIYGFRRADIQVYRKFREGMVDAGGEDVPLARNFRSRPDLLATLSGLFSRVLSGGEDFSPCVRARRARPERSRRGASRLALPARPRRGRGGVPRGAGRADRRIGEGPGSRRRRTPRVVPGHRRPLPLRRLGGSAVGVSRGARGRGDPARRPFAEGVLPSAGDPGRADGARRRRCPRRPVGAARRPEDDLLRPFGRGDPPSLRGRPVRGAGPRARGRGAPFPPLRAAGSGVAPGPSRDLVRGDGGRFRRGADSRRGTDRPEPVEGRGDGEGLRMGRRRFPQALPRGDPPQGRRGPGGGRGPRLRGGGGRRAPLHDPRGEGARVPGRDPRGDLPRRPEGAGRVAGGPGAGPLRGDLPRVPDVFGVPAGAGRGPPGDVRGVGEGEDGGGGAPPSLRRGHPREGSALSGGRGKGGRLDRSGRAAGRDLRGDGGRGGPLPRHGASGRAVAAGGIRCGVDRRAGSCSAWR